MTVRNSYQESNIIENILCDSAPLREIGLAKAQRHKESGGQGLL